MAGYTSTQLSAQRRVSVAPMMDYTDRHFRYFLRLMTRHTRLYTEMVTTGAVLRGAQRRLLQFHQAEHTLALQLGGSVPAELAECARIAEDFGYDEVNLNVGCPSDRVQSGRFGACLMMEPGLVAECVAAMRAACSLPVTVKTRIGVDERDSYAELSAFVRTVAGAGCSVFIVHARKAWLKGLSPKENREIPPLRYDVAGRLKEDFPELVIVVNGGVQTLAAMGAHLQAFDGVMVGREAVANPYLFADVDRRFFDPAAKVLSRAEILRAWRPYLAAQMAEGVPLRRMTRHALGLFQGCSGARQWRRTLSEPGSMPPPGLEVLDQALEALKDAA
jgi:tRNA-dihydrouridine synthase A